MAGQSSATTRALAFAGIAFVVAFLSAVAVYGTLAGKVASQDAEPAYVAMVGANGCIIAEWSEVYRVRHYGDGGSMSSISFDGPDGKVTLTTPYVLLRDPTPAGIQKITAAGPCAP